MSGQDLNADNIVEFIADIFERRGAESYLGEPVTMSEHMLQGAWFAEQDGAPVGFALFFTSYSTFLGQPGLYLEDLFVQPAARGQGEGSQGFFLSVIFPDREMTILDYNRVVRDLNGQSAEQFIAALRDRFEVTASDTPVRPTSSHEYGMFLDGGWYRLRARPDLVPKNDPIGRLPITVLTRNVIEPLLGIKDPRTDKRIDFVGGARGLAGLEKRVSSGEMAVAFALFPTQMHDLMAVADAGGIMPPKSTWFEPKLADGMVSHVLD